MLHFQTSILIFDFLTFSCVSDFCYNAGWDEGVTPTVFKKIEVNVSYHEE